MTAAKRHGFDECGFRPVDTPCWCGWDDEQEDDDVTAAYTLTPAPPVGSIWRQEDGRLVRIVAIGDGYAWVRFANTRQGHSWQVLLAWFGEWERSGASYDDVEPKA